MQNKTSNINEGIKYRPLLFFAILFFITWTSWFIAAYLSYNNTNPDYYTAALMLGLLAPGIVTACFIFWPGNAALRKDFFQRLLDTKRIHIKPLLIICLVMSTTVVFAILISLLFGQSIEQLALADGYSFSAGSASVLLVMILASFVEEIGWRGYGVDSLLSRFSPLKGSLLFGLLWSVWHLPLLFVKDYSPNVLLQENIWYAVNYYVSIVALGIILNWLYVKSNRSTACLIFFHLFLNLMQTCTKMSEFTSCIQTLIIILYTVVIVLLNKSIFLPKIAVHASDNTDTTDTTDITGYQII